MPPQSISDSIRSPRWLAGRSSGHRYTDRRGSTRPRDFHDDRPWGRRAGAQLLRRDRGHLPHLPDSCFAERAGHLQLIPSDLDPGDHHLRRRRRSAALGRLPLPPLPTARRLRPAADPRQYDPRDRLDAGAAGDRPRHRGCELRHAAEGFPADRQRADECHRQRAPVRLDLHV